MKYLKYRTLAAFYSQHILNLRNSGTRTLMAHFLKWNAVYSATEFPPFSSESIWHGGNFRHSLHKHTRKMYTIDFGDCYLKYISNGSIWKLLTNKSGDGFYFFFYRKLKLLSTTILSCLFFVHFQVLDIS